jgi:hypothetical protein
LSKNKLQKLKALFLTVPLKIPKQHFPYSSKINLEISTQSFVAKIK